MTRGLALAAAVLLLAGCAASPGMPQPLTRAEAQELLAEGQSQWWKSMFPDEPEPVVEPVEYLTGDTAADQVMDCMRSADLPDVVYSNGGFTVTAPTSEAADAANRQYFICNALYPWDPSNSGLLSDDEIEWIYNYNRARLVPCLQLLGYPVTNRTSDYRPGSGESWFPYYEVRPLPTAEEWKRIDLRCPPSPVGPDWRPTR